jgi:hypothetical protein
MVSKAQPEDSIPHLISDMYWCRDDERVGFIPAIIRVDLNIVLFIQLRFIYDEWIASC